MTNKTHFQIVADELAESFTTFARQSDPASILYKIADNAPAWIGDCRLAHEAHRALDDRLPDDWVYDIMHSAATEFTDSETADDAQQCLSEIADSLVDCYDADRLAWLSSHSGNVALVDEACNELGDPGDTFARIGYGQYMAIERIAQVLLDCIAEEADDREEAEQ